MDRVSTNLANDDAQFYMRKRERALLTAEKQIASQNRITNLRDEPLAASHAVRYQSIQIRIERFSRNVEAVKGQTQLAEGYIRHSITLLQNTRELAVRFSNGVYTEEDREAAIEQINQHLKELIDTANKKDGDGNYLFSGTKTDQMPFRGMFGSNIAGQGSQIIGVEYIGNISLQAIEIQENSYVTRNAIGSEIFWGKNDKIISTTNAENYTITQSSSISIQGEIIELSQGDTLPAIIQKINNAPIPVRANLNEVDGGITLETTTPQQLWMEDIGEGAVLQDIGLITGARAPYNHHPNALYSKGSIFDILVMFQDALMSNNATDIGTRVIANLDESLNTLVQTVAHHGSLDERLDLVYKQLSTDALRMNELDSQAVGVDYAQAVTELNMLKYSHEAALSVSAKVLQTSLLDYLR